MSDDRSWLIALGRRLIEVDEQDATDRVIGIAREVAMAPHSCNLWLTPLMDALEVLDGLPIDDTGEDPI